MLPGSNAPYATNPKERNVMTAASEKKGRKSQPVQRVAVISLPGEEGKEIREALCDYAKSNDRTMSNQARIIFRDKLKEEGYLGGITEQSQ